MTNPSLAAFLQRLISIVLFSIIFILVKIVLFGSKIFITLFYCVLFINLPEFKEEHERNNQQDARGHTCKKQPEIKPGSWRGFDLQVLVFLF